MPEAAIHSLTGLDDEARRTLVGNQETCASRHAEPARPSWSWSVVLLVALLGADKSFCQSTEASELLSTTELANTLVYDDSSHTTARRVTGLLDSHPSSQTGTAFQGLSHEADDTARWVIDSGNNLGMPFIIVDKVDAKAFSFNAVGQFQGSAPVLIGLAPGDETVPGVGDRAISRIRPNERTTPAGRFVASLGRNTRGKKILWVDYVNAISMHPVITASPEERRAERLATPTPLDNRISYGCINVPHEFFHDVVSRSFAGTNGVVYVLPETLRAREFFSMD